MIEKINMIPSGIQSRQITKLLECSSCGAPGTGSCLCGVSYVAAGTRAARALAANPEKSNRAIAAELDISNQTVMRARAPNGARENREQNQSGAEQSAPESARVTGLDGKSYPSKRMTNKEVAPITKKSAFHGRDRAAEVHAVFTHWRTRGKIAKAIKSREKYQIWKLILQAIDNGFLKRFSENAKSLTIKILFPDAPLKWSNRYLLTDKRNLDNVTMQIMPAAIANRDAILREPDKIESIIREYIQKPEFVKQVVIHEHKVKTLPETENEVVMYDKCFWPYTESHFVDYNYAQLTTAICFFDEAWRIARMTNDETQKSCTIRVCHLVKVLMLYINHHSQENDFKSIIQLIEIFARDAGRNPKGKCIKPPMMQNY